MPTPTVTPDDVRTELLGVPDRLVPESLVNRHLPVATRRIQNVAAAGANLKDVEDAIATEAAYRIARRNRELFVSQDSDTGNTVTTSVAEWIGEMSDARDEARQAVANPSSGGAESLTFRSF